MKIATKMTGNRTMQDLKMTVKEWCSVLDNPRQRDTVAHAKKAMRTHLKAASVTHKAVSAARLPGGSLVKLDGHTRALLWKDGLLECPSSVECKVYDVKSMDEAKELYTQFDSATAVEAAGDRLTGAFREASISPTSGLILNGGFTSAIQKLFTQKTPIYKMVREWKVEIQVLDSFGFPKTMKSGFILGALVLLRTRRERITQFLAEIASDNGVKTLGGRDGVEAFLSFLKEQNGKSTGEKSIYLIAGTLLTCADGYLSGKVFKRRPGVTEVSRYLQEHGK